LSWFLREDHAKTTPILRFAQEQALRVKPMLEGRYRADRGKDYKITYSLRIKQYFALLEE